MSSILKLLATLRVPRIALALCIALGASAMTTGCVYRIDIQQGNFLEDEDIDRVTVGMTRVQVRSLLGTPMVADPFESSRWDYVYYLKRGRLKKPEQRHFIVFFEGDKVTKIDRSNGAAKQPA
jgi:outer membrane protein assembly factor BamE